MNKYEKMLFIAGGILCLGALTLEAYVWIKYGNMPACQVPAWVMWVMGK